MALDPRSCNLLKPFTGAVSYNPFLCSLISPSSATVGIKTTPNGDGARTGMVESCVPTLKKVLLNSFQDATQTDLLKNPRPGFIHQSEASLTLHRRCFSGMADQAKSVAQDASVSVSDADPQIKFKRPDKIARHIMQILDKEAVEELKGHREIPDIKPGYII